jgi:hypothetical protein
MIPIAFYSKPLEGLVGLHNLRNGIRHRLDIVPAPTSDVKAVRMSDALDPV